MALRLPDDEFRMISALRELLVEAGRSEETVVLESLIGRMCPRIEQSPVRRSKFDSCGSSLSLISPDFGSAAVPRP